MPLASKDDHAFCCTPDLQRRLWSWWLQAVPLRRLLFCLRIVAVSSNFITRDDPRAESWVVFGHLTKLKAHVKTRCFWPSVKSRGTNFAMHVQVFHENFLVDFITDSNHMRELKDCSASVLMNELTKSFHVLWHFANDWSPWTPVILNRYLAGLETRMALKNLCSTSRNFTKILKKHFEGLGSRFAKLRTIWCLYVARICQSL